MFYSLIKLYAGLAIKIYCTKIIINKPEVLQQNGPILLACNHPNSFLDGVILTTLFDAPVYSLARGDAFKNSRVNKLLRGIKLLPVYRTSEGVENLEHNYTTFASCRQAFEENSIVLIFSEGRCENEWHLRPLRKGTARLAITSWEKGIPLTVIPTAINYSSFKKFGKEVHLFFIEPINSTEILQQPSDGKKLLGFNEQLNEKLQKHVYEIDPADKKIIAQKFSIKIKPSFYLLAIPAFVGWLLHAPMYYAARAFSKKFYDTGHYDSVLTGVILLAYPFYFLLLFFIALSIQSLYGFILIFLMPFSAWACTRAKHQLNF